MVVNKGLVVDVGNTRIKAAVFGNGGMLSEVSFFEGTDSGMLNHMLAAYRPDHSLVSAVGTIPEGLLPLLQQHTQVVVLSYQLVFPFVNEYATPHSLGMDRAAGVAGAVSLFPHKNCLVIDAGTCVTFDFVTDDGRYLGGAISPGLRMRLRAMHAFTQKLPEVAFELPRHFIGTSTQTSLLSGAYFGLLGEINDTIQRYEEQFGEVQVILCGGDAGMFDKRTKKSIFAAPDLVLHGLFKILQLNAT
jgi:type III pantothenate kinase